jgi:dihydrofolate reductase
VRVNLVDEYRLLVHPIALGKGKALFSELEAPLPLKLIEAIPFGGGAVAKVFRPMS